MILLNIFKIFLPFEVIEGSYIFFKNQINFIFMKIKKFYRNYDILIRIILEYPVTQCKILRRDLWPIYWD